MHLVGSLYNIDLLCWLSSPRAYTRIKVCVGLEANIYILLNLTVNDNEQSHSFAPTTHGERTPPPAVSGGQDSCLGPVTSPRQIRRLENFSIVVYGDYNAAVHLPLDYGALKSIIRLVQRRSMLIAPTGCSCSAGYTVFARVICALFFYFGR